MKKRLGNFTMIPNNYINDARLDAYEFRVFCYLMRLTDDNLCCYPSYGTIAIETGMSLSKAKRAIKKLEECGIISKECRGRKNNAPLSNLYTVRAGTAKGVCETGDGVCDTPDSVYDTGDGVCDTRNQYPYNNNHCINNQTTNSDDDSTPSGYDLLMEKFDEYEIEGELRRNFKNALEIMYISPFITVGNEKVPRDKVHARLENLSYEHIVAVDRNKPMRLVDGRLISDVRNPVAYIVTALYNCFRYTEQEIIEMEYE